MWQWLTDILDVPNSSILAQAYRFFMVTVTMYTVLATAYVTVPGSSDSLVYNQGILVVNYVFLADFVVRVAVAPKMTLVIRKWLALIDLFSFLPYLAVMDYEAD
jgi:hypothetical protein